MAYASNQTSNYGLCQWEQTDLVVHSDFNEDNQKIDAALHDLQTAVNGKASQSSLNSLSSTVSGKASTSTVSSLSSRVSSLESGKASNSTVNALTTRVSNLESGKASVDDVEDLSAACAMVVTGSYTGNGKFGEANPRTLTFTGLNRTPKLVVIRQRDETTSDALVMINGMTGCMSNLSGNYSSGLQVTITKWELNKVTWYATSDRAGMNSSGEKYCYFAVG